MDDMVKQLVEAGTEAVAKNLSKAGNALTTGHIDRSKAEKKAISEGKIAVTQTATQLLTDKMKELDISEEYAKMALINEFETIVKKRSILDKIFGKSKNIINNTPQDNTQADHDVGEIDDDWLNRFRDVACLKSSEEAQEYFSKVLAIEIRNPGSFSPKALRTLADMDSNIAQLFKTFCSLCLVNTNNPHMYYYTQSKSYFKIEDARIPFLTEGVNDIFALLANKNESSSRLAKKSQSIYNSFGLTYSTLKLLSEYGLIEASLDTSNYREYYNFWYNNELWIIVKPYVNVPQSQDHLQSIPISGYALTSVGIELFHIIELQTPLQYWGLLNDYLQELYEIKLYN